MKNIDPIHTDIKPDAGPEQATNPVPQTSNEYTAATYDVATPDQNPVESVESNVTQQPSSTDSNPIGSYQTIDSSQIYPTALTTTERYEKDTRSFTRPNTPISVFVIALLTIVASLHGLFTITRVFFFSSVLTTSFLGGADSLFGSWSWLVLIVGLIHYTAMLYAGYRIWRGSIGALGFVAGLSFTSLYGIIIILPSFIQNISSYDFNTTAIYILYLAFYLAIAVAWIKDRRYFS